MTRSFNKKVFLYTYIWTTGGYGITFDKDTDKDKDKYNDKDKDKGDEKTQHVLYFFYKEMTQGYQICG